MSESHDPRGENAHDYKHPHNTRSCRKCISIRHKIMEKELLLRRITAGVSSLQYKTIVERREKLQNELQRHLDEEFDKLPLYMQFELYRLNPATASVAFKAKYENETYFPKYVGEGTLD